MLSGLFVLQRLAKAKVFRLRLVVWPQFINLILKDTLQ